MKADVQWVGGRTLSMGTPRVSGRRKMTKMSAMVCQAPKKMKTPYFMVHIIIKNTCGIHISAILLRGLPSKREQTCGFAFMGLRMQTA